jgi:hypothetical protein
MGKIVAVLLMAALAIPLASNAPAIDAIFTDTSASATTPPLMYAGIRG